MNTKSINDTRDLDSIDTPASKVANDRRTGAANVHAQVAENTVRMERGVVEQIKKMTEEMKEALDALDYACSHIKRGTMDFVDMEIPKLIREVRTARMALTGETSILTTQLEDLRKFFLGRDYETEMARLREFTELCERLERLKQSGFLDSVADTLLKLA
jgi:hypothetical protein